MQNTNPSYASPGLRIISGLNNQLIFNLIYLLAFVPVFSANNISTPLNSLLSAFIFVIYAGTLLAALNIFLLVKAGGALGELLTGISVVTEEEEKFLSFKRALFRTFAGGVVSWTFLGLGFIWIFIDEKKRSWGDLVSQTVVVKKNQIWVFGLLVSILLLGINIGLARNIYLKFSENKSFFQNVYADMIGKFGKGTQNSGSLPFEKDRSKIPGSEARMDENGIELYQVYEAENIPFRFQYPQGYKLNDQTPSTQVPLANIVISNGKDSAAADITIRGEPLRTSYFVYTANYQDAKRVSQEDYCNPPMTGVDIIDEDCIFQGIYTRHAFVQNEDEDVIFVISTEAKEKGKELSQGERWAFSQVVYSLEFLD